MSLVSVGIKHFSGWVRAFVCVMRIDYLSFKSASMNLFLKGRSVLFLCLEGARYVYLVLCVDSEYLVQPGEIKDIIHNVFTEYLLVGKLKCPFQS